jgi:16S rRNA (adenine1518-N6/adenine1519-N6)-dimethyltransferase
MIYNDSDELVKFLQKNHLWNKKSLGQNFLVNFEVLKKILEAAEITAEDFIVEVGTGLAVLTESLAANAKRVETIEFDPKLIPILREYLQKFPNVNLEHQDALTYDLPTVDYKLVANIPYYITSPLLNHFLQPTHDAKQSALYEKSGVANLKDREPNQQRKRPSLIVLLVQKEVAEKICAKADDHSVLSLQVQIFGKPTIVSMVSKNSFFPAPKVDSAILKIEMYPEPLIKDLDTFFKLIKRAFLQRRKTLLNSLGNGFQLSREQTAEILKKAGIAENQRPQALSIQEWENLGKILSESLNQEKTL